MEFELEVTIDRPVREVFAYVTDISNVPRWQQSAVSAEWLDEGRRRFSERRHFMGRNAEIELEVTVLEPERRFDFRAVKAPVRFDIRHTFEAVDGGTRVHVHGEAKLSGALRLAAGMARRQAEHQFRGDFERLKELLERRDEERPSDPPPRLADE